MYPRSTTAARTVARRPSDEGLRLPAQGVDRRAAVPSRFLGRDISTRAGTLCGFSHRSAHIRDGEADVTADGRPLTVTARFARALEDPALLSVAFTDGRYHVWQPPPVGGRVDFPLPLPSNSGESSRTSLLRRIAEVRNVCDSYLLWFHRSWRHSAWRSGMRAMALAGIVLVLPVLRQRNPKRFAPRSRRPGPLSPRPPRTTGTGGFSRVSTRAMRRCGCCGRPLRTRPASRPPKS